MLAYFPTPYPDELFFSVISRLAEVLQYPHQGYFSKEVFGREQKYIDATLAYHLGWLLTVLPPGHDLTAEKIIQEQTLFPFYQPFVLPDWAQKAKDKMIQPNPNNHHQRMTLYRWKIPESRWLRFCYDCLVADRKQYGQSYWHRLHQVPGVKVCPQHGALIQESQVSIYYRPPNQRYCSAEQALTQARPVPNPFPPAIQQTLLQLARDAMWLLQHDHSHITSTSLLARFRWVLVDQGLAPYQGRLYIPKIINRFKAHYSPELLDLLGCPLDYDDSRAWLIRTIRKETAGAKHPLQQLLAIRALGYSVETFFALPTEISYFGQGPWSCLNLVCDHYRQAVIDTYQLDYQKGNRYPQATFACQTCGFTYLRLGPDTNPEDRYRLDRIVTRGALWETHLAQLRADPTMGPTEIARQLNADPSTVTNYVIIPAENRPDLQAQREQYRAIWLDALARFPQAKVGELKRHLEIRSAYNWLLRCDRDWYNAHTRERKTRHPSPDSLQRLSRQTDRYWHTRDAQLAEEVRLIAQQLLSQSGKPQKLTQSAICCHLNLVGFQPKPQTLPITVQTLKTVAEPYECFAVRRLLWAIQTCDVRATRSDLIRYAGLDAFFRHPHKTLGQTILNRLDAANLINEQPLIYTLLPSLQQDWPGLDTRLAASVIQSAQRLKHNSGYPTRITVSAIGLDLDQLEALLRHLVMLPQTAQTLAQVLETETAFAQRVLAWIDAQDPDLNRCENRSQFVRLTGLQAYDHLPDVTNMIDQAFEQLQTQRSKNNRSSSLIDWVARDNILAPAVRQAAQTLKERADVWITTKSIGQLLDETQLLEVSSGTLLLYQRSKLPQTDQALQEVVETRQQFIQRRLYQLAEQFHQQGLRPTKTQLLAGINDRTLKASPLLQQTINDILTSSAHLPSTFEASLQARWAEIDTELAPLIEPAARHLKAQTDPFVWVSKSTIADYLGQYTRITSYQEKLPKTTKELDQVVETSEEFALRRIQWWGRYYQAQKIRPLKWQFITKAGVAKRTNRLSIQAAIAEVMQTLASFPTE
jgi:hypothetical protein